MYINVTVTYIAGRPAIMTIYEHHIKEGEETKNVIETIELNKINDKPLLHALFQEKGFVLKPGAVVPASSTNAIQRRDNVAVGAETVTESLGSENLTIPYKTWYILYGMIISFILVFFGISVLRSSGRIHTTSRSGRSTMNGVKRQLFHFRS